MRIVIVPAEYAELTLSGVLDLAELAVRVFGEFQGNLTRFHRRLFDHHRLHVVESGKQVFRNAVMFIADKGDPTPAQLRQAALTAPDQGHIAGVNGSGLPRRISEFDILVAVVLGNLVRNERRGDSDVRRRESTAAQESNNLRGIPLEGSIKLTKIIAGEPLNRGDDDDSPDQPGGTASVTAIPKTTTMRRSGRRLRRTPQSAATES